MQYCSRHFSDVLESCYLALSFSVSGEGRVGSARIFFHQEESISLLPRLINRPTTPIYHRGEPINVLHLNATDLLFHQEMFLVHLNGNNYTSISAFSFTGMNTRINIYTISRMPLPPALVAVRCGARLSPGNSPPTGGWISPTPRSAPGTGGRVTLSQCPAPAV